MARLITTFSTESVDQINASDIDQRIRAYIDDHVSGAFDDDISEEDNWHIFYHLSELRTGIISWYDFKPEAEVLEIGAGFGALTGTLCKKCAHVTAVEASLYRSLAIEQRYRDLDNLDIYAGKLKEIELDRKYDYIVMIGMLETVGKGSFNQQIYADYLTELTAYLKPEGLILIAVENRYGIRYFCGATDHHTNRPFDGINHYPFGTGGYSFSRQELIDILRKADLKHKFYFPLPDYRLTQLVYTMEYLPEKNLKERLIPYYLRNDTMIAMESELYDDIIDNQVFPFFANSFFVECSLRESFCDVIYAALSTDRGPENSFATTILRNGKVIKRPLYTEGVKGAQRLIENTKDLITHQIPLVEHLWKDGAIEMPYVKHLTLSNYIKTVLFQDITKFYEILDQIYSYILASSEEVPPKENDLIKYLPEDKREEALKLDWGPILRRAYIELILLNCFYDKGDLLFFDQEYVRSNYPAKYVMFRAIHYIYGFTPNAESFLPIQKLKEKYDMIETWDLFLMEEKRFLKEIRQQDRYHVFYKWARFDWNRMLHNLNALESEEEQIAKMKIPEWLKNIWNVELRLLDIVDALCKKHGLQYFLIHGTLLGAVRHKGFIPWDDDIDIALPRKDYDKLINIAQKELTEHYFLQTPENDQDCFYGGYMKLRSSETTGIEMINWEHNCHHGIWIDIFPLDNCYDDLKLNRKKLRKVTHLQRLLFAKIYSEQECFRDMKKLQWKSYQMLSGFYNKKMLYQKLEKALRVGNEQKSETIGVFTHYTGGKKLLQFNKEDFASSITLPFEYRKLPVPVGYKNCLESTFGENYASYPAKEDRVPHHKAFFAPLVPYRMYTKRFMDTFKEVKNKTVVLFGAGMMFDDYMEKKGKEYPPTFIVDNNSAKWGTTKHGIPIRNPEDILKLDKEQRVIIICNIYFRQIEDQLRKMGITDYFIYVQEKEWLTSDPAIAK